MSRCRVLRNNIVDNVFWLGNDNLLRQSHTKVSSIISSALSLDFDIRRQKA